jgi:hypothetical protein
MKKTLVATALAGAALSVAVATASPASAYVGDGTWNSNGYGPTIARDAYGNVLVGYYRTTIYGGSFTVSFSDNPGATWVSCDSQYGPNTAYLGSGHSGVKCVL